MKKRNISALFLYIAAIEIFWTLSPLAYAYDPPIAIQDPDWGSLHPIDSQAPSWPTGWPSREVKGFYYYDNTDLNCSNRNTYGYPDVPRCSFPATVKYAAGSYIEIHGGSYIHDGTQKFVFKGTEAKPIWFRGVSVEERPTLGGSTVFNGSYAFIENLYMTHRKDRFLHARVGADTGPRPYFADHLSFRHIEVEGDSQTLDTGHSAFGISGNSSTEITDNIVFYDMHIHNIGSSVRAPVDYHGFKIDEYAKNIWILDSDIHHLQGDSVQVGSYNHKEINKPHHVWIGGNSLHDNAENALDVKNARDLIFASNDMYGFHVTDSSAGNVVGVRSYVSRVHNVWIINNKIHKATVGIGNLDVDAVFIIGNLIYDITDGDGSATKYGVLLYSTNRTNVVLGNVLHDNEYGLGLVKGSGYDWDVQYNYFLNSEKQFVLYAGSRISRFDYNKFHNFRIIWTDNKYNSLEQFQVETGLCVNCTDVDDPQVFDFSISARNYVVSPAIKESLVHPAFSLFEDTYGMEIFKTRDSKQ